MPPKNLTRQSHTQTAPQQSHALHALTTCPPRISPGNHTHKQPRNNLTPYTPSHHASPKTPGNLTRKPPRKILTPHTPSRHARQYARPAISYTNSPATIPRLTRPHDMPANMHTWQSHTQTAPQQSHALHTFTPCQPKNHTRQPYTQTAPQQSHALHAFTPCPPICTPGNLIRKSPRKIPRLTRSNDMPAQKHPAI